MLHQFEAIHLRHAQISQQHVEMLRQQIAQALFSISRKSLRRRRPGE